MFGIKVSDRESVIVEVAWQEAERTNIFNHTHPAERRLEVR